MELLELEDSYAGGPVPEDQVRGEYLPDLLPMRLREVAPLQVTQPDGVSFTLDGNLLRWQNWQLRLGFNHREGLVLHQVAFQDGAGSARWRTGSRSPRWWCRTGTPARTTTGGRRSTSASGGLAS